MTPAQLRTALQAAIDGSPRGQLEIGPQIGLSAALDARLAALAARTAPNGALSINLPELATDAQKVTATGSAHALGFAAVKTTLTISDTDEVRLRLEPIGQRSLQLRPHLRWSKLTVDLRIDAGSTTIGSSLTGELQVGPIGTTTPGLQVSLATSGVPTPDITSSDPLELPLELASTAALSVTELLGETVPGVADLVALVPGLDGTSSQSSLTWALGGDSPGLRATWALPVNTTIADGNLSVTATGVTVALVPLPPGNAYELARIDAIWQGALELEASVTAFGHTTHDILRVGAHPFGPWIELDVGDLSASDRRLDALVTRFDAARAPHALDPIRAAGHDRLDSHLSSLQMDRVRVKLGPLPGQLAFVGDGALFSWPGEVLVEFTPGEGIRVRVSTRATPMPVAALLQQILSTTLPAVIAKHSPTVGLALREFDLDQPNRRLRIGGEAAGTGWALGVAVELGTTGSVGFEVGDLYGHAPALPTLEQLLDELMPGGAHTDFFSALHALIPSGFTTLIGGTSVSHGSVEFTPAHDPNGSHVRANVVVNLPFSSGGVTAIVDFEHVAAPASAVSYWNLRIETPFLEIDIADMAAEFGLPTTNLGFAHGDLGVELDAITVSNHGISFETRTTIAGLDRPILLSASAQHDGTGWDWALKLASGPLTFDLTAHTGTTTRFSATLEGERGSLRLGTVARHLGLGAIPDSMDLSLDDLTLTIEPGSKGTGLSAAVELGTTSATLQFARLETAPGTSVMLLGVQLPRIHLGFGDLPVIGPVIDAIAPLAIDLNDIALAHASAQLDAADVAKLQALVTAPIVPTGTPTPIAHGLLVAGTAQIATASISLATGGVTASPTQPPPPSPTGTPDSPAAAPTTGANPGQLKWTAVNKSLGPVHLAMVGLGNHEDRIIVGIGGALNLSILELALIGLRASMPLAALSDPSRLRETEFALDGMGIAVKTPSLEIAGALVSRDGRLDGAALLKTSGLTLKILASMSSTPQGDASIFAYGVLDRPLGGPAFFFVTGLAAGFGYNRDLRPPPVDHIPDFLPVRTAAGTGPKADDIDVLIELLEAPETLAAFPEQQDSFFVALGVRFTSFKILDTFLLLSVAFGESTRISIVGTSTLELPPKVDGVPRAAPPLAHIRLALKATYDVEHGHLDIRGLLVGSYVLSPDAKLTGGFAVVAQFTDDDDSPMSAGEFVATVGGYHPSFVPESWYPKVPRLALTWQISEHLGVKGTAYFALTAGAAMAGGSLDAHWEAGGLSARFHLAADFLVEWEPYHYHASFSMGVHGSLDWKLFTISVSVSAEVKLYGPPFGGTATVDLTVCSKTIAFGAGEPTRKPLPIDRFVAGYVPPADRACGAELSAGAINQHDDGTWMVLPARVVLGLHTAVPATTVHSGQAAVNALVADDSPAGTPLSMSNVIADQVQIVPSATTAATPLAFSVMHDGADVTDKWAVELSAAAMPTALWQRTDEPNTAATVDALKRIELTPAEPTPAPHSRELELDVLLGDDLRTEAALRPLRAVVDLATLETAAVPNAEWDRRDRLALLAKTFGIDPHTVAPADGQPGSFFASTLSSTETGMTA